MVFKVNVAPPEPGSEEQVDERQRYWKRELERAEKYFSEKWWPKADKLYTKYAYLQSLEDGKRRYAMLWANTEVLKPAVYARPPIPQVSRRYKDKDPIGRLAAELLERASSYEFERMEIDSVLRAVRDDQLIPGRGIAWVRYEADFAPAPTPPQQMPGMPAQQPQEVISGQRSVAEYLHYRQFLHEPARRWEEVGWVAKITYMTDEEGQKRFGEAWKGVQLDNKADSNSDGSSDEVKDPSLVDAQRAKATVYEIWSKRDKKTIFVAKACNHVLEEGPPLLDFQNFFPCPKPVYSTVTNNSLIPTPDYKYYQDQAEEIDQLTDRIHHLVANLKLVGFYPAGAEGDVSSALEKALSPDTQNQMIPIASWAAFGERGGGNAIVWLPIKDVVETVKACIETRNQLVQDVYQITGISDILRGATDSSETATAQSIKAQWGSIRIQDRQQELARFARDLTRMVCEVIAENFEPDLIMQMANMQMPQPPEQQMPQQPMPTGDEQQDMMQAQQFEQAQMQMQQQMAAYEAEVAKFEAALDLLRDDKLRGFRIDIETDSTIQPDEDAEKERRTEFVTAVGSIIQQAVPLLMQAPEMAPLIKETLLFTARGFRAGRQLEDAIEQAMDGVMQRIQTQMNQPPAPDPTVEAKAKAMDQEYQHKERMHQLEMEHRKGMGEFETSQGKAKLKDQFVQEDAAAFMGQPGEQMNGVAQVIEQALQGFLMALQQSNATVVQANAQLVQALTAPKTITAPDGRTYTATVQ